MTTLTLSSPLIDTKAPAKSTESRLAALGGYIRDAVRHCGARDRGSFDFDDLVQAATLEVWKELKDYPDAPIGYIWQVAYRAALHVLRMGKSVDSPGSARRANYQILSLETLLEHKAGQETGDALARRRRRGEIPNPTQDIAVANLMGEELEPYLVPRERQAFLLLLREYQAKEIAVALGISGGYAQRLVMGIRIKAAHLWEIKETRVDPSLATRKCYERNKAKYNANRRERRKSYGPN